MIRLEPGELEIVRKILREAELGCEVRVFGSRFHGRNLKPFSDLDLVLITHQPMDPLDLARLQERFSQSDLPFKVDLVDWAAVSVEFRRVIESGSGGLDIPSEG